MQQLLDLQAASTSTQPVLLDDVNRTKRMSKTMGRTLGQYTNAVHHADGSFSTVYKALDPGDRVVALKDTVPAAMEPPHDSVREARILRDTAGPNVIRLLDTFSMPGGSFVLVFPFMPHDLEQMLRERLLLESQVQSHLKDLFNALEHLHSKGIIHRDVKPSNLLLQHPSGPAYLADFGIAWSGRDKDSEPAEKKITDVGTTSYRPPELLFGHAAYDCSLDMWAAGCVVAEAVTLRNLSLFDAGALGSELALIQSIFKTLGTPSVEQWPVCIPDDENSPTSVIDQPCRKHPSSPIGERWNSTSLTRSHGMNCYRMPLTRPATWSVGWYAMRAVHA